MRRGREEGRGGGGEERREREKVAISYSTVCFSSTRFFLLYLIKKKESEFSGQVYYTFSTFLSINQIFLAGVLCLGDVSEA